MGIYDSNIDIDFGPDARKKMLLAGAAVLAVLVIAAVGLWANENLRPQGLALKFEKNPLKSGEQTRVVVTVTNIEKADAVNVKVGLEPKEKAEFDVFPFSEGFSGTIGLISAGASREITYVANPVGKVLPGTYTFVAKTTINGKSYEKEAVLTVQHN